MKITSLWNVDVRDINLTDNVSKKTMRLSQHSFSQATIGLLNRGDKRQFVRSDKSRTLYGRAIQLDQFNSTYSPLQWYNRN